MFSIRDLSVLQYANGFTMWHYKAGTQRLFDIGRVGYFNDAIDMFARGDMIVVSGADGGTIFVVASVEDRRVVTAPLSPVRQADPEMLAAE